MLRSFYAGLNLVGAVAVIGIGVAQFGAAGVARADHDDDDDNLPLYLTRTVDATAQDTLAPGTMWVGAGIPATDFLVKRNEDAGVELAIKAHYRQGADIRPTYVDDDGRVHVEVPAGPQVVDPAHGVPVANPARAAWNFTFSFDAALPGARPSLDFYDGELWIDLDPSSRTRFLKLRLAKVGSPTAGPEPDRNGYGWKAGSTVVIGDDEGTARVTQNSQNYAFYASLIDTSRFQPGVQPYTFGTGQFDVVLTLDKKGRRGRHGRDDGSTRIHVVFDVVNSPTP
jgi:hypothetical protein